MLDLQMAMGLTGGLYGVELIEDELGTSEFGLRTEGTFMVTCDREMI